MIVLEINSHDKNVQKYKKKAHARYINQKLIKKKSVMLNTTDFFFFFSRDNRIRTSDLYVPNVARYQLRHIPIANCDAKLSVFFKNQNKKMKKITAYVYDSKYQDIIF